MNTWCPCHSKKPYAGCCGPFHEGVVPLVPLQLMRARYAAYALGIVDFIIATTDPENPTFCKDTKQWRIELLTFCQSTEFQGLEILESDQAGDTGTVTFMAQLLQAGRDISFTEKSFFVRKAGRWYYSDAVFSR